MLRDHSHDALSNSCSKEPTGNSSFAGEEATSLLLMSLLETYSKGQKLMAPAVKCLPVQLNTALGDNTE